MYSLYKCSEMTFIVNARFFCFIGFFLVALYVSLYLNATSNNILVDLIRSVYDLILILVHHFERYINSSKIFSFWVT